MNLSVLTHMFKDTKSNGFGDYLADQRAPADDGSDNARNGLSRA